MSKCTCTYNCHTSTKAFSNTSIYSLNNQNYLIKDNFSFNLNIQYYRYVSLLMLKSITNLILSCSIFIATVISISIEIDDYLCGEYNLFLKHSPYIRVVLMLLFCQYLSMVVYYTELGNTSLVAATYMQADDLRKRTIHVNK